MVAQFLTTWNAVAEPKSELQISWAQMVSQLL